MAKLFFYYSAMNAGKSTVLLQSAYNYNERGMDTLLLFPSVGKRDHHNKIASRIGLEAEAFSFAQDFNLFEYTKNQLALNPNIKCLLIDEAQFLTKQQVYQVADVVDKLNLPTLTYGIRSDFQAEPFEGSIYLLTLADNIIEIKTICHCGRKALMNLRIDADGNTVKTGNQVDVGGNDKYITLCRKHFNELTAYSSKLDVMQNKIYSF